MALNLCDLECFLPSKAPNSLLFVAVPLGHDVKLLCHQNDVELASFEYFYFEKHQWDFFCAPVPLSNCLLMYALVCR